MVINVDATLYPFESHYFDSNGLRLHYLDEGRGDPIVMLHGNPTWSFYFRNLVLAVRGRHRCIVPDHIGCGLSDKPTAEQYDFSLKSRIDDLEQLLEHLNLRDNVTLVLHDWGGMIGMGYAVRHPERIRRLIVLNTAAFHKPAAKRLPWGLWLSRNTRLGAWLVLNANAFCRMAAWTCVTRRRLDPKVRAGLLAPYDSPAHRLAVLRFVQTIPLHPADAGYDLVTGIERGLANFRNTPMLICWGMKDFVFDEQYYEEWRRRFPYAEAVRLDDCGHYVLEDAPAEIVECVKRFLSAHPIG